MKLLGCLLLLALCTGCGSYAANNLTNRTRQLQLLIQMVNDMMNQLRYTLPTVNELINSLTTQQCYGTLDFLQAFSKTDSANAFSQRWAEGLSSDSRPIEERTVLLQIGDVLGSTDLEGQLAALTLCKDRLETLLQQAEDKQHTHSTLYRSMGILSGLFLVILFI